MKKTFTLIILFLCLSVAGVCGQSYPKGVYMSIGEILERRPVSDAELIVKERPEEEVEKKGGSPYIILSGDEEVDEEVLRNTLYAYSDGEDLYVNTLLLCKERFYSKVLSDGRFIVFRSYTDESSTAEVGAGVMFGVIGKAIARGGFKAREILCVFDKERQICFPVSPGFVKKNLKKFDKDLWNEYKEHPTPAKLNVMLYYLDMINASDGGVDVSSEL